MSQIFLNQIPIANSNREYEFPVNEVSMVLATLALGAVGYEIFRRTRTRVIPEPIRSYFDDDISSRVVELKVEIKFRDNPFYNRIILFEYEGNADYKISGYEFDTHQARIPEELFYDWQEDDRTKVMIVNKSHFKSRKISNFEVIIEHNDTEYRNRISEDIDKNRIILTNDNDLPVRNYLFSLPIQTNVTRLKDDPRIYDLYTEGRLWFVKVREIPAAKISEPERMTILF